MKTFTIRSLMNSLILVIAAVQLTGCAAMLQAVEGRNISVSTRMSESIFMDPVDESQQTVHVRIRNTTGEQFDLEPSVKAALRRAGFHVTNSPSKARFRLQANVLAIEKADQRAADAVLGAGYGAQVGSVMGASGERKTWRQRRQGGMLGGVAGAFTEQLGSVLVKNVVYMVVTDIELVEKSPRGVYVRTDRRIDRKDGMGGRSSSTMSAVGKDIKYRTRIVSTAKKTNLEMAEALPPITQGVAKSISGLF